MIYLDNEVLSKSYHTDSSQTIGYYTAGCIKNSSKLPMDGIGYQVIRPSRKRFYGHTNLIKYIKSLSHKVSKSYSGTLLIGDLSQQNGGPLPDDHSSHQNGLDVDILFWQHPVATKRILLLSEREVITPQSLFAADNTRIGSSKWEVLHGEILKLAASPKQVRRVFVNPRIKRILCDTYQNHQWLRTIRPWWGHDGHFHVRLSCPEDSPLCEPQEPIPGSLGCGESLNWWFTADAEKEFEKLRPKSKRPLPRQCLSE